ncbi:hypothetical protein ACLOJK_031941 [Asimina triloba]
MPVFPALTNHLATRNGKLDSLYVMGMSAFTLERADGNSPSFSSRPEPVHFLWIWAELKQSKPSKRTVGLQRGLRLQNPNPFEKQVGWFRLPD